LLALALVGPGVRAAGSDKVQTVEQLRAALRQNSFVPRAFIKGDQVRLYFTNAEQRLMFNYLLKHGVRVYFYPGMTHVKALLADGWVCFGSANANTLSLRLNQEADLATSDPGFAARFKHDLFETDFEKSYELKEPVSVSWGDHLADSLLNQF